jgi:hypothetical protein
MIFNNRGRLQQRVIALFLIEDLSSLIDKRGISMKKSLISLIQIVGVLGFVLGILQFEMGIFIGFFCTGVFFISLNKEKVKSFGMLTGMISLFYSFYFLCVQTNLI